MTTWISTVRLSYFALFVLSGLTAVRSTPVLHCVSCANAKCPPEPNCVLDRVPCGCCNVCALSDGEECHGFSPSCGANLQCITPGGTFDERPPWFSLLKGVCTPMYAVPHPVTLAPTIPPQIGR